MIGDGRWSEVNCGEMVAGMRYMYILVRAGWRILYYGVERSIRYAQSVLSCPVFTLTVCLSSLSIFFHPHLISYHLQAYLVTYKEDTGDSGWLLGGSIRRVIGWTISGVGMTIME